MKKYHPFIVLLFFSLGLPAQKAFQPVNPDVQKMRQLLEKDYSINNNLIYFDSNYKAVTGKTDIKLDADFDNIECGFTKKYEPGITYIFENCGEAKPQREKIIFPKISSKSLKNWIELLYQSNLTEIKNVWHNENEYSPHDREAGCYYKIIQGKKKTTIDIWCGS